MGESEHGFPFFTMKTCKYGHILDEKNTYTYVDKVGKIRINCKTCRALRASDFRRKKK